MPNTVALIAHDRKKQDLVALARQYRATLSRFHIITTDGTGQRIAEATGLPVERVASGASGGELQIAARVVAGEVLGVIFLSDPVAQQPHEPNIAPILRVCDIHNVPLATNLATAELAIRAVAKTQVGHLIFNPVAGQGDPDLELALIQQILEPAVRLQTIFTQPDIDPAEQAKEVIEEIAHRQDGNNTDFIIASGGDGTVSAIAGAAISTGVPLGVIPRGTANAFSVALGIPTDLRRACETIAGGNTRQVDAARCNDLPMILLAGIGFEAGMVEKADRDLKNRLGPLAYVLSGALQLFEQQPFNAKVEMADRTIDLQTGALTVANAAPATSVMAQGFGQVIPDDGLLDVTIASVQGGLQGLNTMAGLFTSAIVKTQFQREDTLCLRTDRIKVFTDPPQKLVVDGELVNANPVEFVCIPKGLTIFAPLSTVT
ncbi:MAG: methylglyoxal synthase [Synechococcus sp.]